VKPVAKLTWLLLLPGVLAAQTPASIQRAVHSITAADVIHRIGLLADDSMLGRATPSPQLDEAARYVAAQFQKFGLKPGGENGTYFQRYPILRSAIDTAHSTLTVSGGPAPATLRLGMQVNVLRFGPVPTEDVSGPIVLGGTPDSTNHLGGIEVKGSWVALIATAGPDGITIDGRTINAARQKGAKGVLFISNRPDAQWANRLGRVALPAFELGGEPKDTSAAFALVEIRDGTAAALGIDGAAERARSTPGVRPLPGITLTLHARMADLPPAHAPNVIGILEGRDPQLKNEYVFFTGHLDHIGTPGSGEGCQARGADTICNGADDDASGSTGVLEAAEAFSMLTPHPKRSIVFMTVSGEERGLWGSSYYVEHPTLPLAQTVADLNTDMIGRNWKDTIAVIGKEHSDLGATLNRIGAEHPELRMTPIDDIWPQENFYFRSDHYNFARKGVPILFFFNGTHPDYHQVSDEVAKIDGEKEARIIQLDFYLGLDIANAAARPKWNPESYKKIVEGAK
jgi:hypothetical protein